MEIITLLIQLALTVLYIFLCWKIVARAGFSGVLSLLLLLPVINIIMIFVFAFSKWPVLRDRPAMAE